MDEVGLYIGECSVEFLLGWDMRYAFEVWTGGGEPWVWF
mgnify:CR=1 FL=1